MSPNGNGDRPTQHISGKPVDLYKDTWVRYLGYANEVGEAFGPILPKFVTPSYVIAFGYVFADTADKVMKAYYVGSDRNEIMRIGSDTLLWQTMASVWIPGKTINIITNSAKSYIDRGSFKHTIRRWGPTSFGLAAIPLIVKPIDICVDYVFDNTLRAIWKKEDPPV